ncbi:MAG: hydrogenase nickel incorporation protein [Parcubacteria group bacterium ADurb.Bin326]|nr:MAG: hydrogenase nickel incorporation protein [Parcubacteria group bacterium ADurb.Bin326]
MHDFHLADLIYKAIREEAEKNNLSRVSKATIALGSIVEHGEEVLPENLKFNIKMLAQGGIAEDLEVEVERIEGNQWILKDIEGDK